ncbi:MAG: indolepyruvate ferredoxin oxidoreductase subunit alpha [Rhodospirillaceae bacterium]|jgi:indolepyruvate ferredoxin oxidoreductase, alpha subunit|nr:indolepyruvate ferredoxin oxidoreductase subunit alpha [Rhodospirillaceae bacterium]MBT4588081.1 indolepyruvate ferredoxin oxidoreductase subunit alpha [Rhodospirillaceae bacterium]MBT7266679.1 indolepyruvate ferredoxin oxidoreductase subunit alpha [Rhodospirillaceae bacterium]
MERSFHKEIEQLRQGDNGKFQGEGILAVTKALLQSGVGYVGGYQGAPVSHLLDVLVQAKDLMGELGVHVEANSNEASAAAMLGASINYPIRGAVTWKSIVGTNVASDALSNLASPGVKGGAMIVSGEDTGEGASVIQERTHAFAMKSSMWLLDPRPNLQSMVDMVENGFQLSEVSNTPVILALRIRACHVQGDFTTKNNKKSPINTIDKLDDPAAFEYDRLAHPPATYAQEKKKVEERLPAAQKFIVDRELNEFFDGRFNNLGIILQGGLYNTLVNRLNILGLGDQLGNSDIPLMVLNVTHPLAPEQITDFCAGKDGVLVMEEGNPEFIEHQVHTLLRKADIQTKIFGKDVFPTSGEYNAEAVTNALVDFLGDVEPLAIDLEALRNKAAKLLNDKASGQEIMDIALPPRPPGFCTGCPERPVFTALKMLREEIGDIHVAADIGCHAFATYAPFSMGNSILGYGMGLASASAVGPMLKKRTISIMGDGGFWHNGLQTGVLSNLFNEGDGVLIIMQNGYASATGQQYIPSSTAGSDTTPMTSEIEQTLKALGVKWLRTVRTYGVSRMLETLREAMTTEQKGLKVIIADSECMLARQRRIKGENAEKLKRGAEVTIPRFGVDEEICTGDHSCIRLSGCPSLSIKDNSDPLRDEPVTQVIESCVGCGLCGEIAHAAQLCPSFYQAERVQNGGALTKMMAGVRSSVIGWLAGSERPQ